MKNLLLLALISITAFTACSKKDNINGKLGDRRTILTTRNWKIVSMEKNNVAQSIKDCEKDNYYVFNDNGTGRWEEGANNCFSLVNPGGGGNNGGGSSNDSNQKSVDPVPTATEFSWSMTWDLQNIYIKHFGREGYDPEWVIENMDYSTLNIRTIEQNNGKSNVYNLHLVAL